MIFLQYLFAKLCICLFDVEPIISKIPQLNVPWKVLRNLTEIFCPFATLIITELLLSICTSSTKVLTTYLQLCSVKKVTFAWNGTMRKPPRKAVWGPASRCPHGRLQQIPEPSSPHISVMLMAAFRPVLIRARPLHRHIRVWPEGAVSTPQDCLEHTDWNTFKADATYSQHNDMHLLSLATPINA